MMFRKREESDANRATTERDSLLSPASSPASTGKGGRGATISTTRKGASMSCILITIMAIAVVSSSLFFYVELKQLSSEISSEHAKVEALNKLLNEHETIIERFNSSVTNSDVLDRLANLELDFTTTADKLRHELENAQNDIARQLNLTLGELAATVAKAEKDISDEVDKVKSDVDKYVITTQAQFSMENSFMIYQLAGTFTLLSCLISMWHMTAHLRKMNQPDVQRKILAILWMVPIYAVTSWFSLVFPSAEGYLAIVKDGYEAYVIYQFLAFCIAVLGKGDRNAVVDLLATHVDHLTPPFRLFGCFELCGCCVPEAYESPRALADDILLQCQVFALQFVFFRPFTTTGMVVLKQLNYYGGGSGPMDYRAPQFYLTIIQNISIFVAFTGLLKFYHAVDQDLAWCRPFAKFLTIKGVVFMTFWQGLAISVLADVTDVGGENSEGWAKSAQNFLICLEMLLFSIAHFYCFPTEEWEEGYRVKHSRAAFGDSIALGDFFEDLKLILRSNSNGGIKKNAKKKGPEQPAIPEGIEGSGADDDATEASPSVATFVHSHDDLESEKAVAEALEEALGASANDPDIVEAKKRLLDSKVLSPDFFDVSDDVRYFSDEDETNTLYESLEGPNIAVSNTASRLGGPASSEATRLVARETGTSFSEILRPSIFTTVASIADQERLDSNQRS